MGNETTRRRLSVYQHCKRPLRLPKQDHLDQVCVSLVDINVDSFSSVKVYQQRIWRLHAVMKKINNFLKKSVFILAGEKLLTYSFLRFPGWKLKKIAETRVRLLLVPRLRRSITSLRLHRKACAST